MQRQTHRIAVFVFDGQSVLGEYVMSVRAESEQRAVDTLAKALRPDLTYQFFGLRNIVTPTAERAS